LYFWATWCGPCKAALPELLAFESERKTPVMAITDEAHGTADMAVIRGTYVLLLVPPGQPAVADTGKYVELWRKQADGKWLMAWDIFNSNKPTPTTN
jgi:thiol-disulfide isomerase/thioredoxin